jgi:chaperone BCS1
MNKILNDPGVASHEGRVLVMTTNHPEKLDEALIRPGRVDHQVAFNNATQLQVKELFERMYTNDLPRTKLIIASPSPTLEKSSLTPKELPTPPPTPVNSIGSGTAINGISSGKIGEKEKTREEELSAEELSGIAQRFARQVPDGLFSPAEIQGFLLKRKKNPRRALEEVGAWVEGMVDVKRRGTKLISVQ